MIKYLGSKRLLLPAIRRIVAAVPGARTVIDPFSGTARVGKALKADGFRVFANDHNAYAATIARCYVQADRERHAARAAELLRELAALPGTPDWFTATYCEGARYFRPENGGRIEAIRNAIAAARHEPELEAILLTALLEAADRVDSTVGLQMAYLKQWAPRALQPLELRLPDLVPAVAAGPCLATELDARDFSARHEGDVAYLDPPYNQHSYLGNYHVWETLVRWDRPATYGIAQKRVDCRERRSAFNGKRSCRDALRAVVDAVRARVLIVSFNDEGHVGRDEIESLLAPRGAVHVMTTRFPRYVGAKIGVFNPSGERVGEPTHFANHELLFVVDIAGTGVDWPGVLEDAASRLRIAATPASTRAVAPAE